MDEKYKNKWYVREDFRPEQFQSKWSNSFCVEMEKLGNCFDTREQAAALANSIRALINAPAVQ